MALRGDRKIKGSWWWQKDLSPSVRLTLCCHLLRSKRLLVFMRVRHLLCHLEFVPKVFGKPNFAIGTQKSHSSPKVWVWWVWVLDYDRNDTCNWQGKTDWKNYPQSARVVILSHSIFAVAPLSPVSRGGEPSNVILTRWMRAHSWLLGYCEALWPCSSSNCPSKHGLGFLPRCCYS